MIDSESIHSGSITANEFSQ
uniref:Uncharacterized protein n=1 Tax=Rhizophora mucronata TaxID=61149 RepID=A0A2P2QQ99_RHIMU